MLLYATLGAHTMYIFGFIYILIPSYDSHSRYVNPLFQITTCKWARICFVSGVAFNLGTDKTRRLHPLFSTDSSKSQNLKIKYVYDSGTRSASPTANHKAPNARQNRVRIFARESWGTMATSSPPHPLHYKILFIMGLYSSFTLIFSAAITWCARKMERGKNINCRGRPESPRTKAKERAKIYESYRQINRILTFISLLTNAYE